MSYAQKLQKIRDVMMTQGLDGFLVPRTDEYQGEYVPPSAERLAWLTGFTGSAGLAVILADKAMVMSDGRYTIQLAAQVDQDLFSLENSQKVKPEAWLLVNAPERGVIGYDPKLHTPEQIQALEKAGLILAPVTKNPVDLIWRDRPKPPQQKVKLFSEKFSGKNAAEKIKLIQDELKTNKADAVVLTASDSVAWLLNIRGGDIPHIPVALSYAVVPQKGKVQWFINQRKVTNEVGNALGYIVDIQSEEALFEELKKLGSSSKTVMFDPKRSSIWFKNTLEKHDAKILPHDDPCILPRACKNEAEQRAMKTAHVRDGVAMVKFLKWFEEEVPKGQLTELSVEKKLLAFRAEAAEFRELSFNTIAGYGANGAIVHYRADEKTNKTIKAGNLLLLDSGAQYEDGTTDITRTIAAGEPTAEMKERFTLVLKGHIALASANFAKGTLGKELDALARKPLQDKGLDYSHGTGHGVGCYLSVHEEAANISPRGEEPVQAGMILSNEPGYYEEGAYGIRIENLVLAQEGEDGGLYFETLTLAPMDKALIAEELLNEQEKKWLRDYHIRVFSQLSLLLGPEEVIWLQAKTSFN